MPSLHRLLPDAIIDPLRIGWAAGRLVTGIASNTFSQTAPRAQAALARLRRTSGRGGEQEGELGARYFRAVADDYEAVAAHVGLVESGPELFRHKRVLELGPGDTQSIGLIARIRGAKSYDALDGYDIQSRDAAYLRAIYEPIVAMEGDRGGFERASTLLCEGSVHHRPQSLESTGRKFDVVLSRAVLEHVRDLDELFASLRRITSDDAVLIHKVDLRCHGVRFVSELDFLMFPEILYQRMTSHDGTKPNRLRIKSYFEIGNRNGFSLVYAAWTHKASSGEVERMRRRLSPQFRQMSNDELQILGMWLVQVGPRHPLAPNAMRHLDPAAMPESNVDKLSSF